MLPIPPPPAPFPPENPFLKSSDKSWFGLAGGGLRSFGLDDSFKPAADFGTSGRGASAFAPPPPDFGLSLKNFSKPFGGFEHQFWKSSRVSDKTGLLLYLESCIQSLAFILKVVGAEEDDFSLIALMAILSSLCGLERILQDMIL